MMQAACAASLAAAESAAEAKEQLSTQRRRLPEQARAFDDGFSVGLVVLMKVCVHTCYNFVPKSMSVAC